MIIDKDLTRYVKLVLAAILSGAVTIFVVINSGYLQFLDSAIIGSVQKDQSGWLNGLYTFITNLASPKIGIIWVLIMAFFLWGTKYKVPAIWAICTLIGGDAVGYIIKHLVQRPRPIFHLAHDTGFSFPSGHVLNTFLLIGIIWVIVLPIIKSRKKVLIIQICTIIFMILVMLSRIYLNAHYPTDAIGAVCFGYTWLQVGQLLYVYFAPIIKNNVKLVNHSYI
ncbi:phosphatase PAP2 family protein [Apilactobacillus ozensis]|uniref:phosphatase PAP2 family protein n=1 Tax=Apilactobacillus ozensis TaxID=866801 RepID=UPI00200B60CC|nr:phosphatase PAP2 family protein [Apilactobacillus ozensis]MCK8606690.1 phosphatase PAP2 family protein [Apilactobacillus ozensis]